MIYLLFFFFLKKMYDLKKMNGVVLNLLLSRRLSYQGHLEFKQSPTHNNLNIWGPGTSRV
jgi:hypothetical protein